MKLMLITNCPQIAVNAERTGVDRIMVDLEILGKEKRQGHLNTVISRHTKDDVIKIRKVLNKAELLVRVNPIHKHSKHEIDEVINRGADIVMLPMFTKPSDVEAFVSMVGNRAVVNLLLETPQALVRVDDIISVEGINEIHVGLNDLHLGLGLKFMFELLSGGIVEYLSNKITNKGLKFGFGGIGRIGEGLSLDPRLILSEHFRLNSSMVILSRDFHDTIKLHEEITNEVKLSMEINKIRKCWKNLSQLSDNDLSLNRLLLKNRVNIICSD